MFPDVFKDVKEYTTKEGYYEYWGDRQNAVILSEKYDTIYKEIKLHGDMRKRIGK
jgi:hypothetical protein